MLKTIKDIDFMKAPFYDYFTNNTFIILPVFPALMRTTYMPVDTCLLSRSTPFQSTVYPPLFRTPSASTRTNVPLTSYTAILTRFSFTPPHCTLECGGTV